MTETIQKKPLIIALSIPFVMILIIAAFIFIPRMFVEPEHDYIYSNTNYNQGYYYEVRGGVLTKEMYDYPEPKTELSEEEKEEPLYYHDVSENKSREISFEEVQDLELDGSYHSPQGMSLDYDYQGDIASEVFGEREEKTRHYLRSGVVSFPQYVKTYRNNRWNNQVEFIGWVISE